MEYDLNQFNSLPSWAQDEIASLTKKLSDLKLEEGTNTFLYKGKDKTPLPNNSKVLFEIENGHVCVNVESDGTLYVNGTYCGLNTLLAITPRASNSFNVKIIKQF